ncbi:phosphopantothenate--cysteine ligase [Streptococcus zalophi]|uniref:Phosphopantothenate--cysteine ligase n=1 Tax=Streptococcus zalophi TaxID=640031 RepID=A0A934P9J9_9STRE|nr:phosphopantothenate--cysteine ligase [Streptococcus zalophi]MBJ8349446.1 phosphopantothenate--cysteine ligase [Streptococcus zalophi]MCR8967359.1 phosphopantothenate--cysteine ligase [Streptococcus zalophi]
MRILVTSGGTSEKIDNVRSITNHATGTLGKVITEELLSKGESVTLVTTKSSVRPSSHSHLSIVEINDVANLIETLEPLVKTHDVLIHSMAVSDYTPVFMTDFEKVKNAEQLELFLEQKNTETKISSDSDYQVLFLKKTPKVISLVKQWNPSIRLIGFKLLVDVSKDELIETAKKSLVTNQADYILANDLSEITSLTHHAYLVSETEIYEADTKKEISQLIYERVIKNA